MVYIVRACESDAEALTKIQTRSFNEDTLKFRGIIGGPPGFVSINWQLKMMESAYYFKMLNDKRLLEELLFLIWVMVYMN